MPAQRKYPRNCASGRADGRREAAADAGTAGIIREVGDLLGIHPEALRHWVKRADAAADPQVVAAKAESDRIRQLERENAELRRANGILKAAAAFFAAERDPRPPR